MQSRIPPHQPPRLLEQLRERVRYLHYSLATEKAYLYWVRFFIRWHGMKHPRDMGAPEIEAFLGMLATERHVSAATHNQALSAILFLYREVLTVKLPWLDNLQRPTRPKRIPVALTRDEVARLLACTQGDVGLVARLLYGTGMRLMEALRLRVKDVDVDRHVIVVRQAKGNKDRVVMLPHTLAQDLRVQLSDARTLWQQDRARGRDGVEVPHALETKYPRVGSTWGWFWVFPSPTFATDPRSGAVRRHHLYEERLQRALKKALGHSDVSTTMIYTHVLKVAAGGTASPLDALSAPLAPTAPTAPVLREPVPAWGTGAYIPITSANRSPSALCCSAHISA